MSVELINLTVTSYLVFQGLAPSLWGPISDAKGRRVAYCCTFIIFLVACIGLAETKSYASLVVLRCLQSTGSASTIAIGSGVIGDITTRAERGSYMGMFQAGLLAPVAIGPVIGGAITGSLGWRAVFWFLTIYGGIFLLCLIFLLPETLRSIVSNGSHTPGNIIAKYPLIEYQKRSKVIWSAASHGAVLPKKPINVLEPFRILGTRYATPVIVFLATYYAVWQMSITAMSSILESHYGLSETAIGLSFIANGVGSIVGTLTTGKILDIDYRRVKQDYEKQLDIAGNSSHPEPSFPLEKARLRLAPLFGLIQCVSIILFGWTIHQHVHIAVPMIATFVTGWTAVSTQSLVMTYLVDVFSAQNASASASASLNFARCLFAAAGTSFIMPMVNGIGIGLAFTICVIIQIVSVLGLIVHRKFAGKWRAAAETRLKEAA